MTLSFTEYLPENREACLALFDSNMGKYFAPNERQQYCDWLAKLPIKNSPYYVVLDDGMVVGAGGIALDKGKAYLTWGIVHRDLHGQGIGRFLSQTRIDMIAELYPEKSVHIDTSQHTEAFYKGLGFCTRLYQPNGLAPGIDKVNMLRMADNDKQLYPSFDTTIILEGKRIRLVPLAASDFEALYSVASDAKVWALHPASDRYQEPVFREFFSGAIDSGMAYRVELKDSQCEGKIIGTSRFNAPNYDRCSIEIGWTFLGREFWGGEYNKELKDLMLYFAFKRFTAVHFCIGANNYRSIAAVKKLGARHNPDMIDTNRAESVFYELTQQTYVGLDNYGKH